MKILVIDDDSTLNRLLVLYLHHKGHEVIAALGGEEGLTLVGRERPDLVVLDVMMPVMDGWEVLARLRATTDVPVILLTAKAMSYEVVHGLKLGADDYIRKPFNLEELSLRIEAVLRRAQQREHSPVPPRFRDDVLLIDFEHQLVQRRGQDVHLSPTEFRLLRFLVERQPAVVTHEQIMAHVWGREYAADSNMLSVYIRYLRQKLEDDPNAPCYIHTEWGRGYRFESLLRPSRNFQGAGYANTDDSRDESPH